VVEDVGGYVEIGDVVDVVWVVGVWLGDGG